MSVSEYSEVTYEEEKSSKPKKKKKAKKAVEKGSGPASNLRSRIKEYQQFKNVRGRCILG
jgi:hypothetical protein